MKHTFLIAAATLSAMSAPTLAQEEPVQHPSPNAIVDAAEASDWVAIAAEDLVVMTLAPAADGSERKVIIQLMPAPFSQGWVSNIRTLARAKWYDGITVNRVQDNYVVQWGDPGQDNPETRETDTKPLPEGLKVMSEGDYTSLRAHTSVHLESGGVFEDYTPHFSSVGGPYQSSSYEPKPFYDRVEGYRQLTGFLDGWPFAGEVDKLSSSAPHEFWPVHCYGMVGVGRDYSPDTGSGAELYTVIGHAPRHLDRNIALAGRIISGMEHLSSLPRGSGVLGFYTEEEKDKRTPIVSVRVASDLPEAERPSFEYLSTQSATFAKYAEARANRRDPFFIVPAGGADICNIPVPVRRVKSAKETVE